MIDFENAAFLKLKQVDPRNFEDIIAPMMIPDEKIHAAYQGIRDGVVFSNKRIMVINVQGITGKKKDVTSLPYSKIQAYSVETAGALDLDSELTLWYSGLGRVKLDFVAKTNVAKICQIISAYVL